MMFYREDEVNDLLNCPHCKYRYADARLLPCSETICANCVETLTVNGEFNCPYCNSKHNGQFFQNKLVMSMLNLKPDDVYRNPFVDEFKQKTVKLKSLVEQLVKSRNCPEIDVYEHCSSIRNQIDLAAEKRILEINDIRSALLTQVDDYEKECVQNIKESNVQSLDDETEKSSQRHIDECDEMLKKFRLDDQLVIKQTKETDLKINHLEKLLVELKYVQFKGEILKFIQPTEDFLTKEYLLGDINRKKIPTKKKRIARNKVVSGSKDKTLKIWNLDDGTCERTLTGHTGFIDSVLVVDDWIVSGSGEGDFTIKVWNIEDGKCLRTLTGHTGFVRCLQMFDESTLLSAGGNAEIKLWNLNTGDCLRTIKKSVDALSPYSIKCLTVLDGSNRIVSGGDNKELIIWDIMGHSIEHLKGHADEITCCILVGENKLLSGSKDRTLKEWNLETFACTRTIKNHNRAVYSLCLIDKSADRAHVAIGSWFNNIHILDLKYETWIQLINGHTGEIWSLSAIDQTRLVSASNDNKLKVWDVKNGECIRTLEGHSDMVWSLCVF